MIKKRKKYIKTEIDYTKAEIDYIWRGQKKKHKRKKSLICCICNKLIRSGTNYICSYHSDELLRLLRSYEATHEKET